MFTPKLTKLSKMSDNKEWNVHFEPKTKIEMRKKEIKENFCNGMLPSLTSSS